MNLFQIIVIHHTVIQSLYFFNLGPQHTHLYFVCSTSACTLDLGRSIFLTWIAVSKLFRWGTRGRRRCLRWPRCCSQNPRVDNNCSRHLKLFLKPALYSRVLYFMEATLGLSYIFIEFGISVLCSWSGKFEIELWLNIPLHEHWTEMANSMKI